MIITDTITSKTAVIIIIVLVLFIRIYHYSYFVVVAVIRHPRSTITIIIITMIRTLPPTNMAPVGGTWKISFLLEGPYVRCHGNVGESVS